MRLKVWALLLCLICVSLFLGHRSRLLIAKQCVIPDRQLLSAKQVISTASKNTVHFYPPFGVNLWGLVRGELGLGESTRGIAAALVAANIPFIIVDVSQSFSTGIENNHRMGDHSFDTHITNISKAPYYFNIVHFNPDQELVLCEEIAKKYFPNHYNIGIWWWELEQLPPRWIEILPIFDEMWAGSEFIQHAYANAYPIANRAPIPVTLVPLPLPNLGKALNSTEIYPRSHFNISESDFVYFFNFDYMSVPERKNPLGVIHAFGELLASLPPQDQQKVLLLIKSNNMNVSSTFQAYSAFLKKEANSSRVVFLDQLTPREVQSVFTHLDCFVSLHRSEGFGLGIAQSMANGKPCVVTAYGGSNDICNESTAYMIPWTYTNVSRNAVRLSFSCDTSGFK